MTILKLLATAGCALACGAILERAKADEAFACGGDRVIFVKSSEIELLKRTDPCIAAHFGLKVEHAAAQPPTPSAGSGPEALRPAAVEPGPLRIISRIPETAPAKPSVATTR